MFCAKRKKEFKSEFESKQEHSERIRSHYVVYFTQFMVIISYSTVLTGIWPFLNKLDSDASKTFLGYLVACSSLSTAIFSPIIGWWSNKLKSTRIPFVTTLFISLSAYLVHACLESFSSHRKYWLMLSRFLAGVGASNVTICRSHISTTTLIAERRKKVSILSSCATIAFSLGPMIQSAVVPLGETGTWIIPDILKIDMYTSVAWIMVLLTLINLLLFLPTVFKEYNMLKKENVTIDTKDAYSSINYRNLAWVFIMMNFTMNFNSLFIKLLGTPLAMDEFAMTRAEATTLNSIVMTVCAVISFVTILLINPICKFVSEINLLIAGGVLMIIGRCCFYPWSTELPVTYDNSVHNSSTESVGCPLSQSWCATERKVLFSQYVSGNLFESVGYAFGATLVMTIFSKALGSKQQGTWMGLLTGIGSIARITSPVFISNLYALYGPAVASIVTNIVFVLAAGILLTLAKRFIITKQNEETREKCAKSLVSEEAVGVEQ